MIYLEPPSKLIPAPTTIRQFISGGTLFASTLVNTPLDVIEEDLEGFVELLRELSVVTRPDKNHNPLISPSYYDPNLCPDTKRGLRNITKAMGIWLDNDGAGMPWQQFVALFSDFRIVITNSYNSPKTSPPKYHVFIPTDRAMTADLYGSIAKNIIAQVKAVYPDHGFDMGKLNAAALFYLPCRDRDGGGFFHDLNEPPRQPLDVKVVGWKAVLAAIDAEPPPPSQQVSNHPSIEKIQQALDLVPANCPREQWFAILCGLHHELGNEGFEIADRWSRRGGSKYQGRHHLQEQWRSIGKRNNGSKKRTIGTLFYYANLHHKGGFNND